MAGMISSANGNDAFHGLDQLRQRLSQMSTSIASLKADLERNEPLPSWSSLQSSAQILSHNLGQLMATFDTHREYLTASHAYPLPSFPGHTREELLNQLLRKRLEPRTEDWLKQYESAPQPRNGTLTTASDVPSSAADVGQLQDLWRAAGPSSSAIVKNMVEAGSFDDDFTIEEQETGIETVNTGLRRDLTEGEGEDAEVRDIDMANGTASHDQAAPSAPELSPMPIEDVLRLISTGIRKVDAAPG